MTIRIAGVPALTPAELQSINQAILYICANYPKPVTAAELSDRFGISLKKLYTGIRPATGQDLHDLIIRVRLDQAKLLLHDLDLSMKEITYLVGFSDPNYFSKIFKRRVGKTPGEYRSGIRCK